MSKASDDAAEDEQDMDQGLGEPEEQLDNPNRKAAAPGTNVQAIIDFYRKYRRAPSRRQDGGQEREWDGPPEHLLAKSLYKLRAMATKQGKDTEAIRLLREKAPELLNPVETMEEKAAKCVAYLSANPPASDEKAQKWREFIRSCRKRKRKDEVYRILTTGLPGCLDGEEERRKRELAEAGQSPPPPEPHSKRERPPDVPLPSGPSCSVSAPGPSSLRPTTVPAPRPGVERPPPAAPPCWPARGPRNLIAVCTPSPPAPVTTTPPPSTPSPTGSDPPQPTPQPAIVTRPALRRMGELDLQATSAGYMSVLREMDTVDSNDGTVFVAGLSGYREAGSAPDAWTGNAFGVTCYLLQGRRCFQELEVLGLSKEAGGRSYSYYMATLSYLKAVWHVLTDETGHFRFQPRHSPFSADQSIFVCLGAPTLAMMGPSATAAAFLALLARFTTCRLRRDTAASGHFTMSGLILPVDLINVKLAAAKAAGMTRVVVPEDNRARVSEQFRQDPGMEVVYARHVVDLLHYCLEDGHELDRSNRKLLRALRLPIGVSWHVCGGDRKDVVECCAFPGTGRLLITGTELDYDMTDTPKDGMCANLHCDAAHAAGVSGLLWLLSVEASDWFNKLRQGYRRFDLGRSKIIEEDEETGHVTETKADLHIHFPNPHVGGAGGVSMVLALTELMRGIKTYQSVSACGSVTPCGNIWPTGPLQDVTSSDTALIVTSQHPGDNGAALPKVPVGVEVRGFSRLKDVLQHLYSYPNQDRGEGEGERGRGQSSSEGGDWVRRVRRRTT